MSYDIHSAQMRWRRRIEPEPQWFIVICRGDRKIGEPPAYELATRQVFVDRGVAETYAAEIAPGREPLVVEGRWHQLRFPLMTWRAP